MNERARPYQLVLLLGAPGQGKTSLADEWITRWIAERGGAREIAILDPTCRNWRERGGEWPQLGPDDDRGPEERAAAWIKAFRRRRFSVDMPPPCLLVLEDADVYLGGGQPRGIWRDLFATFRHWRCDVLVIARRTQDIPKLAITSASHVALFAHREEYSREYLAKYLGRSVVQQLPDKPHRYLLVEVDTGKVALKRTQRRLVTTAADLE